MIVLAGKDVIRCIAWAVKPGWRWCGGRGAWKKRDSNCPRFKTWNERGNPAVDEIPVQPAEWIPSTVSEKHIWKSASICTLQHYNRSHFSISIRALVEAVAVTVFDTRRWGRLLVSSEELERE